MNATFAPVTRSDFNIDDPSMPLQMSAAAPEPAVMNVSSCALPRYTAAAAAVVDDGDVGSCRSPSTAARIY